jgi:hypothetical protein
VCRWFEFAPRMTPRRQQFSTIRQVTVFEFALLGDNKQSRMRPFDLISLYLEGKRRLTCSDLRWPVARWYGLGAAYSEQASLHAVDDERKKRLKEVNVSFCCYPLQIDGTFSDSLYELPSSRAYGISLSTRFPSLLKPPPPIATPIFSP